RTSLRTASKSWSVMALVTSNHLGTLDPSEDFGANHRQRQEPIRQPRARDKPGHSPDDRTGLVLCEDLAARLANRLATAQAVLTHAGEDDRQSAPAVDFGHRTEENVDRRPARVLGRILIEPEADPHTIAGDGHVVIAGSDPRVARL